MKLTWYLPKVTILGGIFMVLAACQSTYPEPEQESISKKHSKSTRTKYGHNPTAAAYNVQLGVAYLRQGEFERAKQKLMVAQKQDPKSATVLDASAYFLEMTGEPNQAEPLYLKAIKLNPGTGMALNNYGAFLCRQKRYQDAEKQFLLAVKDTQYLAMGEAYENAGLCALQSQQAAKAENYFRKALQKQPKLPNTLLGLAWIHYNKQDYVTAKQYLARFQQLAKPEPESLTLAILLADQDNDPEAILTCLATLEKQFPHSNEFKAMREKYG